MGAKSLQERKAFAGRMILSMLDSPFQTTTFANINATPVKGQKKCNHCSNRMVNETAIAHTKSNNSILYQNCTW